MHASPRLRSNIRIVFIIPITCTNERDEPINSPYQCGHSQCPPTISGAQCTLCVCGSSLNKSVKDINQHRKFCRFSFVVCWRCLSIFADRDSLREHQLRSGHTTLPAPPLPAPPIRLECDFAGCRAWFYERSLLNRHKKYHSKPFGCSITGCSRRFGSDWHRKIHERTHNRDVCAREECPRCAKTFIDPAALRKHIKGGCAKDKGKGSEPRARPFVCRKCYKRFDRKFCLLSHAKVHLKEAERDRFVCARKGCAKVFVSKANLKRHMNGRCRF